MIILKLVQTDGSVINAKSLWLDEDDNSKIHFIDQRYIPFKLNMITSLNPRMTADFITKMVIRGAPAIGGAAAYGLVQSVKIHDSIQSKEKKLEQILEDAKLLKLSRPTAVDLQNVISEMTEYIKQEITNDKKNLVESVKEKANQIVNAIIDECSLLAKTGTKIINNNSSIIHHCHTGALATIDIGSALGVIIEAHKQGKNIHVFVDETRPRLQGGRLTAWELTQEQVPHTLIADTVSATLMKEGKVQFVLVGADRIAKNGDFANKIGTYNLAVLAKYHNIPMYTVAPWSTFDKTLESGSQIIIEERSSQEVTHAFTEDLQMKQISNESKVFNPAFDVTPHGLLTGIIAPGVIIKPPFKENIATAIQNVKKRTL